MDTMASGTNPIDLTGSFSNTKERRPFLKLAPLVIPREIPAEIHPGLLELDDRIGDDVPIIVSSLVNFTVTRQITAQRSAGRAVGVPYGVINRRRRAARTWIVAILAGAVDPATLHSLTHSWIPQLAGTGPEIRTAAPVGEQMIEFLRGVMSALVMNELAANLVPHARALQAMETVLGIHLRAIREAVREAIREAVDEAADQARAPA